MARGPRDRLIEGAIELVREQGVHGAGLTELLDRSHASRNSLYQHFPSGKSELVEIAINIAGERMGTIIDRVTGTQPADQWIAGLVGWWKHALEKSSFTAGCAVVGAALAESEPRVQAAAGAVFTDWSERLETALAGNGIAPERARSLASFAISALEGAIVQARAIKSTRPLDDVEANLVPLLRSG